jgi:hypothetical protein
MSPRLSPATKQHVDAMYPPEARAEAVRLLEEECGHNIPPIVHDADEFAFERLRFAALKVSNGDVDLLRKAIQLAKEDFRELLGAAGFAWSATAHMRWQPKGMGPQPEGWWTRRQKRRYMPQDQL